MLPHARTPVQGIGTELYPVGQYKAYFLKWIIYPFFVYRWEQVTLIKTLPEEFFPVSQDILNFWYTLK